MEFFKNRPKEAPAATFGTELVNHQAIDSDEPSFFDELTEIITQEQEAEKIKLSEPVAETTDEALGKMKVSSIAKANADIFQLEIIKNIGYLAIAIVDEIMGNSNDAQMHLNSINDNNISKDDKEMLSQYYYNEMVADFKAGKTNLMTAKDFMQQLRAKQFGELGKIGMVKVSGVLLAAIAKRKNKQKEKEQKVMEKLKAIAQKNKK